ncbi:uncharacterized protein METZ01_LOCUS72000 [marine metagenome]|uniref:Uncharacterized protein n=1 Tax=marine metagenome TaxID=408172 RepID=A0A381TSY6_9ZZZZ
MRRQRFRHAASQHIDASLSNTVWRVVADRRDPSCTTDVDDTATTSAFHDAGHCLSDIEGASQVYGERTLPKLVIDFKERLLVKDGSIVYQHVNPTVFLQCCTQQSIYL